MWSSRHKLSLSAVFLFILILVIRNSKNRDRSQDGDPKLDLKEAEWIDEESFTELTKRAQEEIDYLYAAVSGTAKIDEVVEATRRIVEEKTCRTSSSRSFGAKFESASQTSTDGVWTKNGRWWLFSAHFDARLNSLYPEDPSVQIVASTFSKPPTAPVFCHLTYSDGSKQIVKAVLRHIWQRAWDPRFSFYNSYLITCGVPSSSVPSTVSLSYTTCPQVHFPQLPVQDHRNTKNAGKLPSVGVCLKGLDFLEDKSEDFVEWIEFQKLMGADKIRIYVYHVHKNTQKVLDFYLKNGFVEVIKLTLPGHQPNTPFIRHNYIWRNKQQKRRQELIPYNDCFNRFSQSHDYVLIVDSDEYVVPLKAANWRDMIQAVEGSPKRAVNLSSIAVRNVYKFGTFEQGDSESEVSILKTKMRVQNVDPVNTNEKSFINTKTIATVFNHFALHRLHAAVSRTVHVDPGTAIKIHFKKTCPKDPSIDCQKLTAHPIIDTSFDEFREKFENNVKNVKKLIKLF